MLKSSVHPRRDVGQPTLMGELDGSTLQASQSYCRDTTRREARNFYWGFVALPKEQRMAIYALYGFAREVDDDADVRPDNGGLDRFAYHRERLRRCFDGQVSDPVMHVLAHAIARYGIPKEELEAVIRGVERDLQMSRYETWDDLREYCLLVASAIGRMCVRIFGFRDPVAFQFADDLGIAMQLANILRDVREDAELGRIYLPREDLVRFGLEEQELLAGNLVKANGGTTSNGANRHLDAGWEALMEYEIARARTYFESGLRVTEQIPRRATACVLTMAGIYISILNRLAEDPSLPLERRASLSKKGKLGIMLRSWLRSV